MPDLVAWCFHSPRRLFAVVAAVAVLVIGTAATVQVLAGGDGPPAAGESAPSGVPADAEPAVTAAVAFTRRWAAVPAGKSAAEWRAGLVQLVTPELAAGLEKTDPAALPGGTPAGKPSLRFFSVSSAMVEVPLSAGRPVLVTVVFSGGRWLAEDIQPLTGNVGAEPGTTPGATPGATVGATPGSAPGRSVPGA
ncbi:MAG: hypothetical protein QG622_162 [Actinomycetota bacterium]|nr:hypothetical protein [Actinomycetota bacterium]